jgi:hypothetical protein
MIINWKNTVANSLCVSTKPLRNKGIGGKAVSILNFSISLRWVGGERHDLTTLPVKKEPQISIG